MNDPIVFKQSQWRLWFRYVALVTGGYLLLMGISAKLYKDFTLTNYPLMILGTAVFFFALVVGFGIALVFDPDFYTMKITDQQTIRSQFGRWSIIVPVKEVDVAKSRRRTWILTLLGWHRLRSIEGKGLFWFDDFAYGKGQFDYLLEIISQLQNAPAAQLEDAQ
jgi:hypothetical protein